MDGAVSPKRREGFKVYRHGSLFCAYSSRERAEEFVSAQQDSGDFTIAHFREVLPGDPDPEAVGILIRSFQELVAAMNDYGLTVDDPPTKEHREMMMRANDAMRAIKNV